MRSGDSSSAAVPHPQVRAQRASKEEGDGQIPEIDPPVGAAFDLPAVPSCSLRSHLGMRGLLARSSGGPLRRMRILHRAKLASWHVVGQQHPLHGPHRRALESGAARAWPWARVARCFGEAHAARQSRQAARRQCILRHRRFDAKAKCRRMCGSQNVLRTISMRPNPKSFSKRRRHMTLGAQKFVGSLPSSLPR